MKYKSDYDTWEPSENKSFNNVDTVAVTAGWGKEPSKQIPLRKNRIEKEIAFGPYEIGNRNTLNGSETN